MAHTGKITKELRKKLRDEIQEDIFNTVMEAVRLIEGGTARKNNALKSITRCAVILAIEKAEQKYGISLVPEPDMDLVGIEWDINGNPNIKENK